MILASLLATVGLGTAATVPFTPPQPWALGFAAPPRIPFVGDVDADGLADLIVVYPDGDTILDANLTVEGIRAGVSFQSLPKWAGKCSAATVGNFDDHPGTDVAGLFVDTVHFASRFKEGRYQNVDRKVKLPVIPKNPFLATIGGDTVLVVSTTTGEGFRIPPSNQVEKVRLPKGLVWLAGDAETLVAQRRDGTVQRLDPKDFRTLGTLGRNRPGSRPALGSGWIAFGDTLWTPNGTLQLPRHELPAADSTLHAGDFDGDGDVDLVEFRYGAERHTAHSVFLRRAISPGEEDPDKDGLTNDQERAIGTDPLNPDTDNDGLLDGWEVNGYRGLDLPKLGANPRRIDLVCLMSRFEQVDKTRYEAEMARVERFYRELAYKNVDGSTGFNFIRIDLDPIVGDAQKSPWWENRNRFRPKKWQGVVRWMQVTPGGGGQADQLGDGGSCGEGALWAVFVHEFGHQLGLDHEGFWPNGACPIYTSLMNYNYSYSLEDDREKIRYSDGSLAGYVLREDKLDEIIPLPYERVKFLEHGPYRYRLKPNGDTTLIDWNWNGVFGEKGIRADINYAYSTNAGRRDDVGKSQVSPWLFVHRKEAYALFGSGGAQPSISPEHPGKLVLRKLKKPFEWHEPLTVAEDLAGDPVAASLGDRIQLVYPTPSGVVARTLDRRGVPGEPMVVAPAGIVPTVGEYRGKPVFLFWDPATGGIEITDPTGRFDPMRRVKLSVTSVNPPSVCTNKKTGELVLAVAQHQDENRPHRWQVRSFRVQKDALQETGMQWLEGPDGQARGTGRLTVLFDDSRDAPKEGRIYLFGRGMTDEKTPWACTYVAMTLADKTVRGGWLVKRYYDEWTQSRSAPAAAWFGGDIIWSYRWVDGAGGPTDNNLHVGYKALGIQSEPFGDHDDIGFIARFGIRHGILSLGRMD